MFYYPGDFCALHKHSLREAQSEPAVAALTVCAIGVIDYQSMDQALVQHPKLSLALWRAEILEASIIRERLVHASTRPALQRVAHLLCEQLARCRPAGTNNTIGLLNRRDVADATGLSTLQIDRTLRDLRELSVVSCNEGEIEVLNKDRLGQLACFDDHYLSLSRTLSQWKLVIERDTQDCDLSKCWMPRKFSNSAIRHTTVRCRRPLPSFAIAVTARRSFTHRSIGLAPAVAEGPIAFDLLELWIQGPELVTDALEG